MAAAVRLKVAIFITYAIFAVLLNSVGTVILQSIEYFHVDKVTASTLEAFKDLPIAATSFLLASFLPRLGYRRGIIVGLAIVGAACVLDAPARTNSGQRGCYFRRSVSASRSSRSRSIRSSAC